jgi:hypothetical protein
MLLDGLAIQVEDTLNPEKKDQQTTVMHHGGIQ